MSPLSAGIMFCNGTRILLLQRPDQSWGFPGGTIEDGERPDACARRETTEETCYTHSGDITLLGTYGTFAVYRAECDMFSPVINDEHTGWGWFDISKLPSPLYENNAQVIEDAFVANAMDKSDSARMYDLNGWFTVENNPLSKVGVFNYLGRNIPQERAKGNGDKMFAVYRPAEELSDPDCIASFKLVPWIIDHTMLGDGTNGTVSVEEKLARGVTGEQIWFDPDDEFGTLKGNIKCFSELLAQQIDYGKTPLSLGYRCVYEYAPGVFNGIPYTYVQRKLRGNHMASVDDGRMGEQVAVMDGFSFTSDNAEIQNMTVKKVVAKRRNLVALTRARLVAFAADAAESVEKGEDKDGELAAAIAAIENVAPLLEAVEELKAVGDDDSLALDENGAPAGDTAQMPGDKRQGEENGQALDKEDDDKDDEGGKGMDAAEVTRIVNKAIKAALGGVGQDATEQAIVNIAKRDKLASELSEFVGAFDASEMTVQKVAEYGVSKLQIPSLKGGEQSALMAWMHGRVPQRKQSVAGRGFDASESDRPNFLANQLKERS